MAMNSDQLLIDRWTMWLSKTAPRRLTAATICEYRR